MASYTINGISWSTGTNVNSYVNKSAPLYTTGSASSYTYTVSGAWGSSTAIYFCNYYSSYTHKIFIAKTTSGTGTSGFIDIGYFPARVKITYNKNDGSGTTSSQTVNTYDTSGKVLASGWSSSTTKPGYHQAGWATSSSGSKSWNNGATIVDSWIRAATTRTLYQVWEANTYTVYFYANGGSGSTQSQSYTYGTAQNLKSNTFTRTGYTFKGWSTSSSATSATYTDGKSVKNLTTENGGTVKLYAVWSANTYTNTLNYSVNGGSGSISAQTATVTYPNTSYAFTVKSDVPTRTGYTFKGWGTTSTSSASYYAGGSFTVGSTNQTSGQSATLYAVWSANTYTNYLYYDANGGSGAPGTQTATVTYPNTSSSFTVSTTSPSRTGYTFKGWGTTSTSSASYYGNSKITVGSTSQTANQSAKLYAVWTANTYTNSLYYDANGGSGAPGTQTSTVTYPNTSCSFTVSSTAPTRTGYTFKGWATTSSATSASYTGGSSITVGSASQTAGQSTKLYAVWTANTYTNTLAYNANGGSGAPNNQTSTVTYPNTSCSFTVSSTAPTRSGYDFLGWNTDSSATTATYVGGDSITVGSASQTSAQSSTLYAIWKLSNYTIQFDANGGEGEMSSITAVIDVETALPTNTFTRTNYTFLGWNTDSTSKEALYTDGQTILNIAAAGTTTTLYAIWEGMKVYVKKNGTYVKGKLFIKHNGTWVVPSRLYFKKDGKYQGTDYS